MNRARKLSILVYLMAWPALCLATQFREAPDSICLLESSNSTVLATCSGVLVAPNIVATAAHCLTSDVFQKNKESTKVSCGLLNESSNGEDFNFREKFSIKGFKIFNKYQEGETTWANDWGFVVLDHDARSLKPMAQPTDFEAFDQDFLAASNGQTDFNLKPKVECRSSGFGIDAVKKTRYFRTVDRSPGVNLRGFIGGDHVLSSSLTIENWGDEDGKVRHGDSGGPFYCRAQRDAPWLLVGITSGYFDSAARKQSNTLFLAVTVNNVFRNSFLSLQNDVRSMFSSNGL